MLAIFLFILRLLGCYREDEVVRVGLDLDNDGHTDVELTLP